MKIYFCNVYGITPEQIISENIIKFIEERVAKQEKFKIKSVPEGTNPAPITEGIIGYYPKYGIPYISNPSTESGIGTIDLDNKRIIYSANELPFFLQRDSIVYSTPWHTYIRQGYDDIIKEFINQKYKIFKHVQARKDDMLVRHTNFSNILFGEEMRLEDLMQKN